jgi:hypothetical protein
LHLGEAQDGLPIPLSLRCTITGEPPCHEAAITAESPPGFPHRIASPPPLPPFSFNGETASIVAATNGCRPTPPLPPRPYKRGAHPRQSSPPLPPLSIPPVLTRSTTFVKPLQSLPPLSVTRPSHRLPLLGEVPSGFVTSPSPFSAATGEHRRVRAPSWPLSGELPPRTVPGSWRTHGAPSPHNQEPGPRPFSIQK